METSENEFLLFSVRIAFPNQPERTESFAIRSCDAVEATADALQRLKEKYPRLTELLEYRIEIQTEILHEALLERES